MARRTALFSIALLFLLIAAAALIAQDAAQRSTGQIEGSVERSTGQIAASYEPALPESATRVELPPDQGSTVQEGLTSAAAPMLFVFAPPAGRMIEIRTASAGSAASLSIFRAGKSEPEAGTTYTSGSIGWISSTETGSDLRALVWTPSEEAKPFKLLIRVHPEEKDLD